MDYTRTDVINHVIKSRKYSRYLEIGVQDPNNNFNKIVCDTKVGVDPAGNCQYVMTSDQFFAHNNEKWDCVFIDGWHSVEQVSKDIANSLDRLNLGGAIVCDDCLPPDHNHHSNPYLTGDCWLAIAALRCTRSDLWIRTVDAGYGISVIMKSENEMLLTKHVSTWEDFKDSRNEIMNVVSGSDFLNLTFF